MSQAARLEALRGTKTQGTACPKRWHIFPPQTQEDQLRGTGSREGYSWLRASPSRRGPGAPGSLQLEGEPQRHCSEEGERPSAERARAAVTVMSGPRGGAGEEGQAEGRRKWRRTGCGGARAAGVSGSRDLGGSQAQEWAAGEPRPA